MKKYKSTTYDKNGSTNVRVFTTNKPLTLKDLEKHTIECSKCTSNDWDYANVGLPDAILCTNCGHIYGDNNKGENKMTESEFESKFENGDLDCEFAMFISERYDAWAKHQMLSYWEDPDAYQEFKDSLVKDDPSPLLKDTFFGGSSPLDKFPTLWGDKT